MRQLLSTPILFRNVIFYKAIEPDIVKTTLKNVLCCFVLSFASLSNSSAQVFYTITQGYGGVGTISKYEPPTNTLSAVIYFENKGTKPKGDLIRLSNGKFYGMTSEGGAYGGGTIFTFDPVTSSYTVLHNFNGTNGARSYGSLIQATDGKFYGMTGVGGSANEGTLFSFDPATSVHTVLLNFIGANGIFPAGSLLQASDGKLYGMTSGGGTYSRGTIFSFDPVTFLHTIHQNFTGANGSNPQGSVIQASDGKLYGATQNGGNTEKGTLFSFDPATSVHTVLLSFNNANGAIPSGSLFQAADAKLYGMTGEGGHYGNGTAFSLDISNATPVHTILHSFNGTDGRFPKASFIQASDEKLYGTTQSGGAFGNGTIFALDISTATPTHTIVKSFSGYDGIWPFGSLIQASDGKLYGMTFLGGNTMDGNIFSLDISGATPPDMVVHSFDNGTNGSLPGGTLMKSCNGMLYGVTNRGGSNNYGTIFSFDPSTSTRNVVFNFGSDAGFPRGGLLQAYDGRFYGVITTGYGGFFSFAPSTSTINIVHPLNYANGFFPYNSLMQASNGKLYGMTFDGGTNGKGTIYSLDISSDTIIHTALYSFDGSNGANPTGCLIQASDGKLYGMTNVGGSNNNGVIFSFDPSTFSYNVLLSFNGTNGSQPIGNLMQASDGKLYGTTFTGGSNGDGTIFSLDISSTTPIHTVLQNFINFTTDGSHPRGSLFEASDGKLYGMTHNGGSKGGGVIFSLDIAGATPVYTKRKDFDYGSGEHPDNSIFIDITQPATPITYYQDADSDGYGDANNSIKTCTPSGTYVTNKADCNDNNASVHPGATESCNGIDDNCDGQQDEGCPGVPAISINDVNVSEGQTANLTVSLSKKSNANIAVSYKTVKGTAANGKDFVAVTKGSLTIPAGAQTGTISIATLTDNKTEPDEYFDIQLNIGRTAQATINDETGRVTILGVSTAAMEPVLTQTSRVQSEILNEDSYIHILANPTSRRFTLIIQSNIDEKVKIKVTDYLGRLVEVRNSVSTNQTLYLGDNYRPGLYFIEVIKGANRRVLKLLKQ